MRLDAEIDEDKESDAAKYGISGTTHGNGIVNAMEKNGNKENAGCCFGRMIYEMIDGIIIAHQNSKRIMTRNGQERSGDGNRYPIFFCKHISNILNGSKS
jgi:hypothetical protein